MRRTILVGVVLWVASGAVGPVAAQDNAAAEALFDEGRRLMDSGDLAAAAEKFEASDRAAASVGARLNRGDCLAQLGKNASAWASYRAAANLARSRSDSARAQVADKRAADIAPKLTFVVIDVAVAVAGLEVRWDGEVRSRALWGQRFPVDPGEHEIAAKAPGHEPYKGTVSAGAPGAEVRAKVPALTKLPEVPDKDHPDDDDDDDDDDGDRPTGPGTDSSMWTGRRKIAVAVGAAGLVAIGVGSALGLSARSRWNDAEDNHCNAQLECDQAGVDLVDSARTRGNISTVAFAVGVAALGGGAALWFLGAPDAGAEGTALAPIAGPDFAGLALGGTF